MVDKDIFLILINIIFPIIRHAFHPLIGKCFFEIRTEISAIWSTIELSEFQNQWIPDLCWFKLYG